MEPIKIPLYSKDGNRIEDIELAAGVFGSTVNADAIYQSILVYNANQRKGLAATKTRGEVSGGGKKPWKQKGTGRARVGSIRSPLWRHGGVVFGPHPRDFSYSLPQKIRALALKSAVASKVKENSVCVLEDLALEKPSTKEANKIFAGLKIGLRNNKNKDRVLLLLDKVDLNTARALRNLAFLDVNLAKDTNAYEILAHKKIILTKESLAILTKRLQK